MIRAGRLWGRLSKLQAGFSEDSGCFLLIRLVCCHLGSLMCIVLQIRVGAKREQHIDRLAMTRLGSKVQRSISIHVRHIRVQGQPRKLDLVRRAEEFDDFVIPPLCSTHQRGGAMNIFPIHVGPMLEEVLHELLLPTERRIHDWRRPLVIFIRLVDIEALIQKLRNGRGISELDRLVERDRIRPVIIGGFRCFGCRVHFPFTIRRLLASLASLAFCLGLFRLPLAV